MSAFIVSDKHILALVNYALHQHMRFHFDSDSNTRIYDPRTLEDGQALAEMLQRQNMRSVNARYPQHDDSNAPSIDFLHYPLQPAISALQAIKAVQCLEYQSCKTADWRDTDAKRFCDWVMSEAISQLPGYEQAQWSID